MREYLIGTLMIWKTNQTLQNICIALMESYAGKELYLDMLDICYKLTD